MEINKELLRKFYLLRQEIEEVRHNIIPKKYLEGGFVYFEELSNAFHNLYKEFDLCEYSALECLESLMENKGYHDTDKLTPQHRKKYSTKLRSSNFSFVKDTLTQEQGEDETECIMMTAEFYKECKYCFIPLETLDEALNFMESRKWV